MKNLPVAWTDQQLREDSVVSSAEFRKQRLAVSEAWETHYKQARTKFEQVFKQLNDLNAGAITDKSLSDAYRLGLGEALRYLAGPPISDDDLRVIADVDSLAPGVLANDVSALRKVFDVIERVIDPHRFPWVLAGKPPSAQEREAALLASSVLLAAQRIATERRTDGKDRQEETVKEYLKTLKFTEVSPEKITTLVEGPKDLQFCSECQLGARKADVVIRLHDTRLMAIECKVSNSATNSVKRLNNDAAVKATYWIEQFGRSQVVPAAVLAGVFKVLNLEQSQDRGLSIFWSHKLDALGTFIESTRKKRR